MTEREKRNYNRFYTFFRFLQIPLYPITQRGRENLPEGACIVCANHSSSIDPVLLAIAMTRRRQPHFMAKKELETRPIFGWMLKKIGAFFVDRAKADVGALRTAIRYLKQGEMVMIFPEGTRVAEDDALAAKAGAVRLAAKYNVPLVPVFIPRKKPLFRRVEIIFGEAYYIGETERDSAALSADLMGKIHALGRQSA